jgi:hypothetical protein
VVQRSEQGEDRLAAIIPRHRTNLLILNRPEFCAASGNRKGYNPSSPPTLNRNKRIEIVGFSGAAARARPVPGRLRRGWPKSAIHPTRRDAYFVKCDSETTTQIDIDLGVVNVLVGFAPLRPPEFIVLTIQQMVGQVQT